MSFLIPWSPRRKYSASDYKHLLHFTKICYLLIIKGHISLETVISKSLPDLELFSGPMVTQWAPWVVPADGRCLPGEWVGRTQGRSSLRPRLLARAGGRDRVESSGQRETKHRDWKMKRSCILIQALGAQIEMMWVSLGHRQYIGEQSTFVC